jgi:hypothetical protein
MVSVESARERVNLSRAFEKRPGRVVHGFPREGVVTPQQVSCGRTRWVCSLERSCVCQKNVNGGLLMIVLSSDLIIDDSPFSVSPVWGSGVVCFVFFGPQPCLFQQEGCAFCWIVYCKYLHYVAVFRERAVSLSTVRISFLGVSTCCRRRAGPLSFGPDFPVG